MIQLRAILAGELLTPTERHTWQCIDLADGRIAAIRSMEGTEPEGEALDARDGLVIPGLIDVQVNGALGWSFQHVHRAHFEAILRYHLMGGTTTLLPTLITAPESVLVESLSTLAEHLDGQQIVSTPGIHLEGPFLSPEKSGAHDSAALQMPDRALMGRLIAAGRERIRLVTLAPELPGAPDLIADLAGQGIIVAAGHSAARYEQMLSAVEHGLGWITHAGNASDWPYRAPGPLGFMASEPGLVGSLLADDRLGGTVIMDGFHFHPALLKSVLQLKGPEKLLLISDASSVAGCPPGQYSSGGLEVEVHAGGFATSGRGGGWLAGSTIRLMDAVRRAVKLAGIDLAAAVHMASTGPAAMIGLEATKGRIAPGFEADLLVLNHDLSLRHVIVGGWLIT